MISQLLFAAGLYGRIAAATEPASGAGSGSADATRTVTGASSGSGDAASSTRGPAGTEHQPMTTLPGPAVEIFIPPAPTEMANVQWKASVVGRDQYSWTTYALHANDYTYTLTENPIRVRGVFTTSKPNNDVVEYTVECQLSDTTSATCRDVTTHVNGVSLRTVGDTNIDSGEATKYWTALPLTAGVEKLTESISTTTDKPDSTSSSARQISATGSSGSEYHGSTVNVASAHMFIPPTPTDLGEVQWQASVIGVDAYDSTTYALDDGQDHTYTVTEGPSKARGIFSTSRQNGDIAEFTYECKLTGTTLATCAGRTTHINGPSYAYFAQTTLTQDEVAKHWTAVPITAGESKLSPDRSPEVTSTPIPTTSSKSDSMANSSGSSGDSSGSSNASSGSGTTGNNAPQVTGIAKSMYKVVVVPVAVAIVAGSL